MPSDTEQDIQLSVKYVVLGMLSEWMQLPLKGLEQAGVIDLFWRNEHAVAAVFERCLVQLQQEYHVKTEIRRFDFEGSEQISFKSHELVQLLVSFYEGYPTIDYRLFPSIRRAGYTPETAIERASYLKGVYLRWGRDWNLYLFGGWAQCFTVYQVLYDLYCPAVTMTTKQAEGAATHIAMTPPLFLTRLFAQELPW